MVIAPCVKKHRTCGHYNGSTITGSNLVLTTNFNKCLRNRVYGFCGSASMTGWKDKQMVRWRKVRDFPDVVDALMCDNMKIVEIQYNKLTLKL